MPNDVENLSMHLLAIHMSPLIKCLLKYFAFLKIRLFFLLLTLGSSLYIPMTNLLANI